MAYASQTTSASDNIIIQRSYLSSDSDSDYAVTFVSSQRSAKHGIILSLSNWLVLDDRDVDSATKERASSSLTIESAKALVADLNRHINSL
jgi:hypothetical protein